MQKAIRRADTKLAGYWALELWESGYANYVWKRLLVVSAEDCWGILTAEVKALHDSYCLINSDRRKAEPKGRIFISKAVILLCAAKKNRDADHLQNFVYDKQVSIDPETLSQELRDAPTYVPIPAYAYDCHTLRGKRAGKTKADFFRSEQEALQPLQLGLFDQLNTTNLKANMETNYPTATNWKPLERGTIPQPQKTDPLVSDCANQLGVTIDEAFRRISEYEDGTEYWLNNLYQVQVRYFKMAEWKFAHLNIRRRDGKAIFRDWRHFQWIKNQLIGAECEAVEMYPAESRMVDSNNKYHLWVCCDSAFRFPFGFTDRDVNYTKLGATNGTRQRPL
jgi:hypothetical protein